MGLGKRGEGYVLIQIILLILVALAPNYDALQNQNLFLRISSALVFIFGLAMGILSIAKLGQNLTALPRPKEDSELVTSGVYAWVRHPIYSSLILMSLGWAGWNSSPLAFLCALALVIFFDFKARREERYLQDKFAVYIDYKKRVKKFIPFIY